MLTGDRRADIVRAGPAPQEHEQLVVQVSRWDRLKDMSGVMQGFAEQIASGRVKYGMAFIGANNFFEGTAAAGGLATDGFGLLPARPGSIAAGGWKRGMSASIAS